MTKETKIEESEKLLGSIASQKSKKSSKKSKKSKILINENLIIDDDTAIADMSDFDLEFDGKKKDKKGKKDKKKKEKKDKKASKIKISSKDQSSS